MPNRDDFAAVRRALYRAKGYTLYSRARSFRS